MAARAVLVIEDDSNWQHIYREIITDAGLEPQVVTSYREALTALTNKQYVLAIVDMSLSEEDYANRDGLRVLRQIAAAANPLPAIVVTGYATVNLAIETLVELKAVHFFRKDEFDRRKFRQTVEKEALLPPEITGQSQHIPTSFRQKVEPAVAALLSERELEVLYYLSQGQTNKEIGQRLIVSVNTVKKHTQSIFTKLNVNSRAAAVAQALNVKD